MQARERHPNPLLGKEREPNHRSQHDKPSNHFGRRERLGGSALAAGIFNTTDLDLVAAVSRKNAGQILGEVIQVSGLDTPIFATATEALATKPDVFVEYTKPDIAKSNILTALAAGVHVVVGTSGLTEQDYAEINDAALHAVRGVLAVGNFALTAVLLQKFAEIAAKYIPHWEIIDYASREKGRAERDGAPARKPPCASSGISTRCAARFCGRAHRKPRCAPRRDPGSFRASAGLCHFCRCHLWHAGPELILRHEAGSSAEPYVNGALLAIRSVNKLVGLHRGLDSVMEF